MLSALAAATFALAVLPGSLEDRRTVPAAEAPPSGIAAPAAPIAAPAAAGAPEPAPPPASADAPRSAEAKGEEASPLRGLLLPGGALLALGGVALLFTLRKSRAPGSLQIVESVSVGPKRSLVIAKVGDEELVLGCSEAGISLLSSRSATGGEARAPAPGASRVAGADPWLDSFDGKGAPRREERPEAAGSLARLFTKAGKVAGKARRPSFDDLLADSAQDQELRRRLAEGAKGRIG